MMLGIKEQIRGLACSCSKTFKEEKKCSIFISLSS